MPQINTITTMTADHIRAMVIAQRTQAGLKLCLITPDGPTTLYPKNHATRAQWVASAIAKGYLVLES